jgi:hypothetical protein
MLSHVWYLCQFHPHFKSGFWAQILLTQNYKVKLKVEKSFVKHFKYEKAAPKMLVKLTTWSSGQILPMKVKRSLVEQSIILSHKLTPDRLRTGLIHDHGLISRKLFWRNFHNDFSEIKVVDAVVAVADDVGGVLDEFCSYFVI